MVPEMAARHPGLNNRLFRLGERADVPRLMAALDVGVSSSITEGFSNVIGEMMELIITALVCVIFAILAYSLVTLAAGIAGGVHASIGAARTPGWMTFSGRDSGAPSAPANNNSPGAGSGGGAQGGPGGGTPQGQPGRQYAFNRSVGSAP